MVIVVVYNFLNEIILVNVYKEQPVKWAHRHTHTFEKKEQQERAAGKGTGSKIK